MDKQSEAYTLLKDIRHIMKTIKILEDEIAKLYTNLTSTTIKAKEIDIMTSKSQDPLGDTMAEIIEYQEKLKEHHVSLYARQSMFFDVIKQMEPIEQELLSLRYLEGMTIECIAEERDKSYYGTWKKLMKIEERFCEIYAETYES